MAALSQENPLKNVFNSKVIRTLADSISLNYPDFDKKLFVKNCIAPLQKLNFLERSHHLREMLAKHLPKDFKKTSQILVQSLPDPIADPGKTEWDCFIIMPQTSFISKYGVDHFDISMKALYEMTQRFTAEGDLRVFLEVDYNKTMKLLKKWCSDKSPHVRRLVSEGTRPRLPLAGRIKRFQKDPRPVIDLLNRLVADSSLYVRRSVANNINDIVKDHPDIAIKTLKKWSQSKNPQIQWLIRHASRTLIKQGNKDILKLFGYRQNLKLKISFKAIEPKMAKIGENSMIKLEIGNEEKQPIQLIFDYRVDFIKSNGKVSGKVFKGRLLDMDIGEKMLIEKKHSWKDTSGRTHYPGVHKITLLLNGVEWASKNISLTKL